MKALAGLALAAALSMAAATALATADCVTCHRDKTPAAVAQWQASAHGKGGIGCADCHGKDHARIDQDLGRVEPKVCGECHAKALKTHEDSRHGMGLHSGWGCTRALPGRSPVECRFCHEAGSTAPKGGLQCARFLKQSSSMAESGCNACHRVETSCASCHSNHNTSLAIVRDPNVCAKCHMGPDHPQWEMWQTSQHGTLHASVGAQTGPGCQRCHLGAGSHNVSTGITTTSGNEPLPDKEAKARRAAMLAVCAQCHAPAFAQRELARGDAIRAESLALVKEAEKIVWDLADHGLLDPMPAARPPHPQRGHELVTDSQMLYEDTSHIERLFFKMKKYDLAKTVKGAYHQNPAYTHWYGNAELKMDLVDIRAEASRLRARGAATAQTPEVRLRALKSQLERGALAPDEYQREKQKVLDGLAR